MSEARYKIMFSGQVLPDFSLDTVKSNLAQLFKSGPDKIEALFSGQPVALKRDLADQEADRYLSALQRAGAEVSKVREGLQLSLVETEDHPAPATEKATSEAPAKDDGRMCCPKCAAEQPKAAECTACGIIIEKYRARQAEAAPALSVASTDSAQSPYAPPQSEVGEDLPEFSELKVLSVEGRIGRLRYLAWTLAGSIAAIPAWGVGAAAMTLSDSLGFLMLGAAAIGLIIFNILVSVKRLHDIGWSGWLLLLHLVPVVNVIFPLLIILIPGTAGANRYGPPQPPNSTAVKVLASLWLVMIALGFAAAFYVSINMMETLGNEYDASQMQEMDPSAYDDAMEATAPMEYESE